MNALGGKCVHLLLSLACAHWERRETQLPLKAGGGSDDELVDETKRWKWRPVQCQILQVGVLGSPSANQWEDSDSGVDADKSKAFSR